MRFGLVLALTALFADRILKRFALMRLPEDGGRIESLVAFRLHKNTGIAFNIPIPIPIVILLTLMILAGAAYALYKHAHRTGIAISLIFIIAGGIGNLFDRVIYGFTVDYLILFGRSAINISDVMILGGVCGLIFAHLSTAED